MVEPISGAEPHPSRSSAPERPRGPRTDRTMSLPLLRLFYPDPDPTEQFPGESADIEGYVVAPDKSITIAATWATAGGLDMLDAVWASFRRKGIGVRRMMLLDDRGRTVSVMTLHPKIPDDVVRLLRSLLVVPIRASDGFAEVHLFSTRGEFASILQRVEGDAPPLPPPSSALLPAAKETGILQAEDWAFLGLLACVGAFDRPEGPTPELVAELLGLRPEVFNDRAVALEHGLGSLVMDIFASAEGTGELAGVTG